LKGPGRGTFGVKFWSWRNLSPNWGSARFWNGDGGRKSSGDATKGKRIEEIKSSSTTKE